MTFVNFQRFIEFVTSLSTSVFIGRLNSCDLLLKYFEMLSGWNGKGCEFFISSPCLLVHESKIDWLKKKLK